MAQRITAAAEHVQRENPEPQSEAGRIAPEVPEVETIGG
jgi:hypothetical protein